ncbi:GRIP and coiled-coil domain-containing protein 2-like [Stegostoma tigrinum]|uniref:GRIP and coiled-coil domain-containing protein 2-like n=1 Tax=Stegostoma tigrinum TaxID=3053191 RepID=UPI002870A204|nr:GRIP and coiled-coil domain-containing protein 2-like [Stegostoma tigrinum]
MGTQGPGRKRIANRERLSAEDDALNLIAREAEARLAAKRAARAEAREIRMKELERQQKEIYQVQKKYYGLDSKFGDIEQWMEDSEKYSPRFRRHTSVSDEDDWTSVGSRGSARTGYESIGACGGVPEKSQNKKKKLKAANGFDELSCGSGPSKQSSRGSCYSDLPLYSTGSSSKSHTASQNGTRVSAYDGSCSRRYSSSSSHALSEHNCFLGSGSRTSSRASSARASPVVEERLEKDFTEKSSRAASSLSAATLASLGGTSSRRGSGETTTSMDTEGSIREIKDSLAEVEERYKKAMVSNAQLDNEKTNLMYQVDTLRESLLELEEQLAETHRMHEEKTKELDRQKHAYSILQHQYETMKETLKEREEMLAEIKELNQKLTSYTQEISDLQETVEWKDKKIGALERQKEYSDAIRIDRDELREEVAMLKERLKACGLLTNGEAEPMRKDGNTHTEAAETGPQAATQPQSSSDRPLGEGHALQMRNEILETVEQRGVLQNTGIDAQMEETGNREMLMNNVQEKDFNEECDKLTEGEASAVTVRDNGDADQIEHAAANLDGKQSACDTQSLGGKEVSEEIWHTLGSGGGMQCCGNMEENESDLGVNEKHMQEIVIQKLDHDERSQIEGGDPRSHGGMRKEKYSEVRNDIDVLCDDSDGAEADNQLSVEETQKVAEQVLESTIGILQQHLCSCDLQEESRDEGKEVTQEGVGSSQVREDNLTGMQEQAAEVVHVRLKELDGSEEMGKEQEAVREVGFHATTKESCSGNFNNDVVTVSGEAGCVLDNALGQSGKSRSGGADVNLITGSLQDEVKNGEGTDWDGKGQLLGTTLEQVEKEDEEIAEKTEIENHSLTQICQQEVEVDEKVSCHLNRGSSPIVADEVKQPAVHNEYWRGELAVTGRAEGNLQEGKVKHLGLEEEQLMDEVNSDPGTEQGDRTSQTVLQGKLEGNLELSCLRETTLIGEENKTVVEIENRALGDAKSYGGDEVKWHEEDKENVRNTGEARTLRRNEDTAHIKNQDDAREIERLVPDEGKDHTGDKNEGIDQGNVREVKCPRNYEDEIEGFKCIELKHQGERGNKADDSAGQTEIEDCEEVLLVPGVVNSEFKGKRGEGEGKDQSPHASEFMGSGEEESDVKVPIEEEGEVNGPQELGNSETKGPIEEDEDEDGVKGPQKENGKVKNPREEGNAKWLREEDGEDKHAEEGDKAKGFRKEEVKSSQENKEGETGCAKEEEDNVQDPREGEFRGPQEDVEDGVKDPRKDKTKISSEGMINEVIEPKEEEEAIGAIEVVGEVSGTEDENEVQRVLESEKLLCTNTQGIVQEMGKEVSIGEESKEEVFPDVRTTKKGRDKMEEKMGFEEIECDLSGLASAMVQKIDKENQIQNINKSLEETNKGKSKNNTEDVHEVTDSKSNQGIPTKEEATTTKETTAEENLSVSTGEEMRPVEEYEFEGDTQLSEGAVTDLVENNEIERHELNENSEEVAQGSVKQDSLKNAMVSENVIIQGEAQSPSASECMGYDEEDSEVKDLTENEAEVKGLQELEKDAAKEDRTEMQDRKREDIVKEERGMSVTSIKPQNKTSGCGTTKGVADNVPVSQTDVEKKQDDEDVGNEEGDRFEWDETMNEILGDETQDWKEVLETEVERGEVDSGSETGPKPIMSTEPNEHIKPTGDNTREGEQGRQGEELEGQRNECTISNDQQFDHSEELPQDKGQSVKSGMSMWEDNIEQADKEMEQNPAMAEAGKYGKRKSKNKDDCLISRKQISQYFRAKKFIDEKEALLEQIKKLKAQLDERTKNGKVEKAESGDIILENGTDVQVIEMQRDANRQISEYKFKLTKTEQEITALEQNIMRLESQVLRYKTAAENAEKVEDELKAEKRKLQREVRSAQDKIEELEMSNSHLTKRLEKMKANRSALLSQQ